MARFYGTPEAFEQHRARWGSSCDCEWGDPAEFTLHDPTAPVDNNTPPHPELPQTRWGTDEPGVILRQVLGQLDRMRRVILCHPDRVQRVREAVDSLPPECAPGLIEVRASAEVPADRVILLDPHFVENLLTDLWEGQ